VKLEMPPNPPGSITLGDLMTMTQIWGIETDEEAVVWYAVGSPANKTDPAVTKHIVEEMGMIDDN